MTSDIVTQLQNECQCSDDCRVVNDPCISMRAADEIEQLRACLGRIIDVYTTPGKHPEYHEYRKNGLKDEWPSLWWALETVPRLDHPNSDE